MAPRVKTWNTPEESVKNTVIELLEHGIQPKTVCNITKLSRSQVGFIKRAWKCGKEADIEGLRKLYHKQNQKCNVRFVCQKYGIDLSLIEKQPEPEKEEELVLPESEETTPIRPLDRTESATLQDIEDAIHVAQKKMDLNMDKRFDELLKKMDQIATIIQSCCKGIECKIESMSDCLDNEDKPDVQDNWY